MSAANNARRGFSNFLRHRTQQQREREGDIMSVQPITSLSTPEEQHLLFLFLPLKSAAKPAPPEADPLAALHALFSGKLPDGSSVLPDPRPTTGVHFYMAYGLKAGVTPTPPPPFTAFQVPPPNPETKAPRDLAVVMSIYDADFGPYIAAFTNNPGFAKLLDIALLANLDETGFVSPVNGPTTALGILANGGTFANASAFVTLLMRYNWADPTIPAATNIGKIKNPNPAWKYFLGATFPGLTNTRLLKASGGYPNAAELWPVKDVVINYAPSIPPT
jgi:hypothetical protein